MSPRVRITLDMLRMAARAERSARSGPCDEQAERLMNSLEAADYNIRPIWKYVQDFEKCLKENLSEQNKKGKASTMYYLSQYVDQQKHKKK